MSGRNLQRRQIEVALVQYPGAQLAALYGLTDLILVAGRLAAAKAGPETPALRVSHWQMAPDTATPVCTFDSDAREARTSQKHRPAFVILPPSLGDAPSPALAAQLSPWLTQWHQAGAVLTSVCAGAFLLAATGLLKGRAATTHWSYQATLAARHPDIVVDTDKLVIDDGDIITAGGLMAWTDLGLRLVERMLGPSVMLETARFLLIDPAGREQRFYSSFAPQLQHGDAPILKVQHWLQATGARNADIAAMARKAGLEERTFLRRFSRATGLKPTTYCQHLKIGKAREMLELGRQPIDRIAYAVGYEDPGAFRKVFQKVMGLTPGEYRRRFGLNQGESAIRP